MFVECQTKGCETSFATYDEYGKLEFKERPTETERIDFDMVRTTFTCCRCGCKTMVINNIMED